jgi:ribosomal protein S27E
MTQRYDLGSRSREGKVIEEMVDILRDLTLDVEEVSASQGEIEEFLDELDEDLLDVEAELYDDDDEDIVLDDDDALTGDDDDEGLSDEGFDSEPAYVALECPVCHQESSYNQELFDRDGIQLSCPHCGNVIYDSEEDYIILDQQDDDEEDDDIGFTPYR